MHKKSLRTALAISIVLLTILLFIYYLVKNPDLISQITHIPRSLILFLLFMYGLLVATIGLTLIATLNICQLKIGFKEGMLITMYSSIINFFGPLQSGPIFRALYLKKKYNLKIKQYSIATLLYYIMYAVISGLFLLSGIVHIWILLMLPFAFVSAIFIKHSKNEKVEQFKSLQLKSVLFLFVATLLQVCLMLSIYFTELRYINPSISLNQAVIYTGAANFSLFVALTPGAIGFRESFLIFSRRLHHIPISTIIAANVIDRGIYILLLIILVVFIVLTHSRDKLLAVVHE